MAAVLGVVLLVAAGVLVVALKPWDLGGTASPTRSAAGSTTAASSIVDEAFNGPGLKSEWKATRGLWSVRDGALTGQSNGLDWPTVLLDRAIPENLEVTFRARVDGDSEHGGEGVAELMLHVSGRRYVRAYFYTGDRKVILGDGAISYGSGNSGKDVASASYPVRADEWFDLRVTALGQHYTIDVNGVPYVEYEDTSGLLSPVGQLGFTGSGGDVHFDDVKVKVFKG